MKIVNFFTAFLLVEAKKKKASPEEIIVKRAANLIELWSEVVDIAGFKQQEQDKYNRKYARWANKMIGEYERLRVNKKCEFPDNWEVAQDEDPTRYVQDDPCTAAKQVTNQLVKWSMVFNVNCKRNNSKFESRVQGKVLDLQDTVRGKICDQASL